MLARVQDPLSNMPPPVAVQPRRVRTRAIVCSGFARSSGGGVSAVSDRRRETPGASVTGPDGLPSGRRPASRSHAGEKAVSCRCAKTRMLAVLCFSGFRRPSTNRFTLARIATTHERNTSRTVRQDSACRHDTASNVRPHRSTSSASAAHRARARTRCSRYSPWFSTGIRTRL